MSTEGKKFDAEKTDMSLLSSIAIYKIADVMTFGKKKYSANNWRGGIVYSRLVGAALRHIFSWLGGESLDPETGKSHLAHASCCLMMLLEFETTRPDLDDRYKSTPSKYTDKDVDKFLNENTELMTRLATGPDTEFGERVTKYIPKSQP